MVGLELGILSGQGYLVAKGCSAGAGNGFLNASVANGDRDVAWNGILTTERPHQGSGLRLPWASPTNDPPSASPASIFDDLITRTTSTTGLSSSYGLFVFLFAWKLSQCSPREPLAGVFSKGERPQLKTSDSYAPSPTGDRDPGPPETQSVLWGFQSPAVSSPWSTNHQLQRH